MQLHHATSQPMAIPQLQPGPVPPSMGLGGVAQTGPTSPHPLAATGPFFSFDTPVEKLLPPGSLGAASSAGKAQGPASAPGPFFSFDAPLESLKAGETKASSPVVKPGRPAPPVIGRAAATSKWVTIEERASSRSRSRSRRRRDRSSSYSSDSLDRGSTRFRERRPSRSRDPHPVQEEVGKANPSASNVTSAEEPHLQHQRQSQNQVPKVGFQLSKPAVTTAVKAEGDETHQKQKRQSSDAIPAYSAQSVFAQFQQQMQAAQEKKDESQRTFTASELLEGKDKPDPGKQLDKRPQQLAHLSLLDNAQRVAQQQQLQEVLMKLPASQADWTNRRGLTAQSRLPPPPPRPSVAPAQAAFATSRPPLPRPSRLTSRPYEIHQGVVPAAGHYAAHAQARPQRMPDYAAGPWGAASGRGAHGGW